MTQLMRELSTRRGVNTMVFGVPTAILAALAVVIGMQGADGSGGGGEPPGVSVDPVEVAERVSCTPER